jgi:hypothetical protein
VDLYLIDNMAGPGYWIGGRDLLLDGNWKWQTSNVDVEQSYTRWGPAQPNDAGADCIELYEPMGYFWADCGNADDGFICEIP